jgi:hypothetical protein
MINPLKESIEALKAERERQQAIEKEAHDRWVDIGRQIGKLETQAKKVAAIVGTSVNEVIE